jgi:alanine racemase
MSEQPERSQWIEISSAALESNLLELREIVDPHSQMLAVVKANAYGHGLSLVAPIAARNSDWLGVHTAEEARVVRRLGITCPVLIMGYVTSAELRDLDPDIHVLVSSEEVIRSLGRYRSSVGISLPIHLKIDTGTKRQGVAVSDVARLCSMASSEGLSVVGIATHFANIEDTLEHDFARRQIGLFDDAIADIRSELGESPPFVHAACSAAALLYRETDYTLVRVGISMYGHWPSRETQLKWRLDHGEDRLVLRPCLSWKSVVGQLNSVRTGETVGYGRTWTALRPTTLAVVPVGYSDGYPRSLGGRSRVIVNGRPAPVVGRVCMNILMADVTDIPGVGVGDEVVLIGCQGPTEVTAEELAGLSGTINYELLARVSPAVPRIIVGDRPGGGST